MIQHLQKIFLLLLLTIAINGIAADDNIAEKIMMGGSSLGIRDSSKQDTEITFNVALSDLLKAHSANLSVLVFDSTQDLYNAFDKDQIHGIFGTPLEYLQRENKMKPQMMAIHYKNAALKQSLIALVRSADNIKSIKDLRGKRLSMRNTQDMEKLFLNTMLLENQAPELDSFFAESINPKNINTGIMDVFFGRSDITIVRESEYKTAIELNPQLAKKLTVLAESEPFLVLVAGAKTTMPNKSHQAAMQSLVDLSSTEKGKQLMRIIHAESFEEVSSKDLDNVRDLLKRYKTLKSSSSMNVAGTAKTKKSSKATN
jgi:ABC-type phosphate/phosphonate transport system substrate-binding protein